MKKSDLIKLHHADQGKTLLVLLYRICANHLRDEELTNEVSMCTARYNRYSKAKLNGTLPADAANERNQIDATILAIINQLPPEDFPVEPPTSAEEVKRFYESGLKTKSWWKRKSQFFLYPLIVILFMTSVALWVKKKQSENPIDALEANFIALYANEKASTPSRANHRNLTEYEGLWAIDTDSVGYVGNNCYNVLEDIGAYTDDERLVFYPIKSIMRIWSVASDSDNTKGELRGIEFVKTAIIHLKKNEQIKKLTDKEIEDKTVANLGTVFFNFIYFDGKSQKRTFFNMVHQCDPKITNDNAKAKIAEALSNIANREYRTCTSVSKPENVGSKIIILFKDCFYDNKKYIRAIKRIPHDTYSH
jgi:Effector-associated domain 11